MVNKSFVSFIMMLSIIIDLRLALDDDVSSMLTLSNIFANIPVIPVISSKIVNVSRILDTMTLSPLFISVIMAYSIN